jgi:hypothetical protein
MTLLTVVRDVCAAVGVIMPSSVFTNITGNRTMQEMLSVANEMAQRIAYDKRDWTKLKQTKTYVGNGVTAAFDMPADYQRMLLTANVWRSSSQLLPMSFVPDTDVWLNHRLRAFSGSYGEWTLLGSQMHIYPVMPVGQSAYYAYLSKNCITLSSSGVSDTFLNDGDSFLLGDRLLKLGMIMEWKQRKGGAYAEDMGTFEDALNMVQGHDSPGAIIVNRRPISADARTAYPGITPS